MKRKAVKLVGLVLIGAAAFSALRRWLHRSDDDGSDPPVEVPPLVPVPDLEPVPSPTPAPAPQPEPEAESPPAAEPAPEPEPALAPEPASEPDAEPAPAPGSEPIPEPVADDGSPRWRPPIDDGCPPGYPIKVNERSGIYHVPEGLSYERTRPTRCYVDEASAQADGFRRAKR